LVGVAACVLTLAAGAVGVAFGLGVAAAVGAPVGAVALVGAAIGVLTVAAGATGVWAGVLGVLAAEPQPATTSATPTAPSPRRAGRLRWRSALLVLCLTPLTGRNRPSTGTTSVLVFGRIMSCPFFDAIPKVSDLLRGSLEAAGFCLRRCALRSEDAPPARSFPNLLQAVVVFFPGMQYRSLSRGVGFATDDPTAREDPGKKRVLWPAGLRWLARPSLCLWYRIATASSRCGECFARLSPSKGGVSRSQRYLARQTPQVCQCPARVGDELA
jgi:hypothetical protein